MAGLTQQQKAKLPPELRVVLARFHQDPQLLVHLKQILTFTMQKVAQHAINHETFCDAFWIPDKLPNELLKLYGMTTREMQDAMAKIGFHLNRMYLDPYYQALCIAYLIGLEFDDDSIRKLAIFLIDIKIWNGRKYRAFRTYCDSDTARYVLNYVISGRHSLKKIPNGSAFTYLDSYSVPAIDKTYKDRIANNLDHPTKGLRVLIETNYGRIVQLFRSLREAYYKTMKEGKKEIISGTYKNQYGEGDMVETRESFTGNIERLVDKIEKNAMLRKNILLQPQVKSILKKTFNVSDSGIKKINDWLEEEDNQNEVKYFFELLFTTLKPKNESDICKYDVTSLGNKITSSKKDQNLIKAKTIIDHILKEILGDKFETLGYQNKSYLRRMVAQSLVAYGKVLLCKKA
jgi:hypothetical protein